MFPDVLLHQLPLSDFEKDQPVLAPNLQMQIACWNLALFQFSHVAAMSHSIKWMATCPLLLGVLSNFSILLNYVLYWASHTGLWQVLCVAVVDSGLTLGQCSWAPHFVRSCTTSPQVGHRTAVNNLSFKGKSVLSVSTNIPWRWERHTRTEATEWKRTQMTSSKEALQPLPFDIQ